MPRTLRRSARAGVLRQSAEWSRLSGCTLWRVSAQSGCHAQATGSCLLPSPLNTLCCTCPNDEPAAARGGCRSGGHLGEQCSPDDSGLLPPNSAMPRSRRLLDPLASEWEPFLLPLLDRHPALTPNTLLEHLQEQKTDQDWSSVKRTLQRRVQHCKALHGLPPELMFPLADQPGEIGFCDFPKVKLVQITLLENRSRILSSTTAWRGAACSTDS